MTAHANPNSTLLCIDTTSPVRGLALFSSTDLISSSSTTVETSHTETLIEGIKSLLTDASTRLDDLEAVAIVNGPGSFSGIRIGISTALALGRALEIPVYSRNALEILANFSTLPEGIICPVLDARRGAVYLALFDKKKGEINQVTSYFEADYSTAFEKLKDYSDLILIGSGAGLVLDQLPPKMPKGWRHITSLSISLAEQLGRQLQSSAKISRFDPPFPEPFYIRPPDIRKPRKIQLDHEK